MITLLRCFVARRALRWLPAVEAALSAILFALLLPSSTPVLPATICFVAAWLLQRALGGFANAPFQPALAAFALAFLSGVIPASPPTLTACITLLLIAFDRLYLPITARAKLLQLGLTGLITCLFGWLGAALAAYCCALLALQAMTPWIDRLTLPRIPQPA